jgi:HSP20 family protein
MSSAFPPLLGGGFDRGDTAPALLGDTSLDEDADDTALALPFSMGDVATRGAGAMAPPMRIDVEEMDNKYLVTAEAPGFNKQDLHVRVENGLLTIEGKHREERKHEDPNRRFLRTERVLQSVRRTLRLSSDVEQTPEKIKARYQDGVLKIEVPKLPESQRAGSVEIAAGVEDEPECPSHVNFEREAASAVPDPKLVAEDDYKPSGVSYS